MAGAVRIDAEESAFMPGAMKALLVLLFIRSLSDFQLIPAAISFGLNLLVAAALLTVWVHVVRTRSPAPIPGPLAALSAMTVLWLVVGAVTIGAQPSALADGFRFLSICAAFGSAYVLGPEVDLQRTTSMLVRVMAPAMLVLAVSVVHAGPVSNGAWSRGSGTFQQSNAAAYAAVVFTMTALYCVVTEGGRWMTALAAVGVVGTVATLSLGGLSSLIVATAVFFLVVSPRLTVGWRVAIVTVALAGVWRIATLPAVASRLDELQTTNAFGRLATGGDTTNSLDWRFLNWSRLIAKWHEHPLMGYGQGATAEFLQPLGKQPHSEYVRILVEFGAIGFALWVAVAVGGVGLLIRESAGRGPASWALIVSLAAATAVNAMASNTASYPVGVYLMSIVVGLHTRGRAKLTAVNREAQTDDKVHVVSGRRSTKT